MPITNTKQNWEIGATVKVGFLSLKVVGFKATPGGHDPDEYELESAKGVRYIFSPHNGLYRIYE